MPDGAAVMVTLRLDACGYRIPPGHRLRLALSNAYWPQVLPTPGAAAISLDPSGPALLTLPLLGAHRDIEVAARSEEHTSELQSLMSNSYAVFCLNKKTSMKT